ncbi:hypothetical protein CTEN210_08613 [Chaetoceros tenuissimus]|uniref:Uncharacterized protein n=1 Tax=Chaetoceros tenuissimus TaxID=426638 RepID=A0AAD3CTV8_9STRA|nr:hypothetical protein CTEN210_08613 [Chaetoceros tenuissimus]
MNLALSILLAAMASCAAFAPPSSTAIRPTVSSPFQQKKPSYFYANQNTSILMSEGTSGEKKSDLPMLLDPGTKGGALFLSLILFIVPIIGYEIATIGFGVDGIEAGKWIGVGFTFFTTVLWVGTYIFRVATKDMTYAKQLKDYENAVIAKRLEELDDDEIQALVEDIERDDF